MDYVPYILVLSANEDAVDGCRCLGFNCLVPKGSEKYREICTKRLGLGRLRYISGGLTLLRDGTSLLGVFIFWGPYGVLSKINYFAFFRRMEQVTKK